MLIKLNRWNTEQELLKLRQNIRRLSKMWKRKIKKNVRAIMEPDAVIDKGEENTNDRSQKYIEYAMLLR